MRIKAPTRRRQARWAKSPEEYVERNVTQIPECGCWLWTGVFIKWGYGSAHWQGCRTSAHRLSYQTYKGPIPDGMLVCHKCDVRSCVNPAHLFLGTYVDNYRDMLKKGRENLGGRVRGEKHPRFKYPLELKRKVIAAIESGTPPATVAREFAMKPGAVYYTIKHKDMVFG